MEKYVVLEHLLLPDRGMRFWTMNTKNNVTISGGKIAYKEVHFTSDVYDAIDHCSPNSKNLPSFSELFNYYKKRYDEVKK
jgi:hypothetical protein